MEGTFLGFHVGLVFVFSLTYISSRFLGGWVRMGVVVGTDLHHQRWVRGVDSALWGRGFREVQNAAVVFETGSW